MLLINKCIWSGAKKNLVLSLLFFALLFLSSGCKKNTGNPVDQNPTAQLVPATPTLSTPANNSAMVSIPPTLMWNASYRAESYYIEVFIDSGFSGSGFSKGGLTGTSMQISALNKSTKYYWHVRAINSNGTSPFSATWNFTTENSSTP